MTTLQMKDLPATLALQTAAGNAVLLLGLPGIGKTQIVQRWLAQQTAQFIVIDGSQTPAELVQGIPYVSSQTDELHRELMAQMNQLKQALQEPETIVGLNVEELSSFSQDDQRTIMNMVLAGEMPDGTRIDRNRLYVVATANPSAFMNDESDASVHDIETALLTRMAVYEVVPDVTSWLTYAATAGIHPVVQFALRDNPALFNDEAHRTVPRTLTFLSKMFYAADQLQQPVLLQDVEALVGPENAAQFQYVYEHLNQLINLLDVVTDQEAYDKFVTLSDAEKSVVWLTGLTKITAEYDDKMRQLAELLPSDTLIASFQTDTIWAKDETLRTARFLAGAWEALQTLA